MKKNKIINLIKKYEEIIRYLIIGGLSTVVSLVSYFLLVHTIFDPHKALQLQCANVLSWFITVTFAYFTNRRFVFKSQNKSSWNEVMKFGLSRIATLIVDMLIMFIFVSVLKFNDTIIKLVGQVIVIVLNYILSKFIVFKK